jgi:alanine racemase
MRAHALISLHALRHNLQRVRELAPDARIMAVIKANAYGHGMQEVARALDKTDSYAVATMNEASALRAAGIDKDIIVLQGATSQDELLQASHHAVTLVVHSQYQLNMLESMALPAAMDIWLKIDTGMHRLGFAAAAAAGACERLRQCDQVENVRIMSHFANADDPEDALNARQLADFLAASEGLADERSIANSAALCAAQAYHLDWVRPGIMLYGVNPFLSTKGEVDSLQPVMTLSSRLLSIQQRKRGDTIGYGATWTCPEDMPVGIVSIGYGDGYPRHAKSGTPVLINGIRVPLIGRVSMDMISIDLRPCPQAAVADEVILWGNGLPVEEVALCSDTIAYELLCQITSRVEFSYS